MTCAQSWLVHIYNVNPHRLVNSTPYFSDIVVNYDKLQTATATVKRSVVSWIQFYGDAQQCECTMFHTVYRMHKELRDASVKPTADVSCLMTTVDVSIYTESLSVLSST